jgi:quercetin dioxygenase-like cupin family protein
MMMKKQVKQLEENDFTPTRTSETSGVMGKSLLPEDMVNVKVTLTHVLPGGKFPPHRDTYHHVFYIVKGKGEVFLGDETYRVEPGTIVEIPAETLHGYQNTSDQLLELIICNIPQ